MVGRDSVDLVLRRLIPLHTPWGNPESPSRTPRLTSSCADCAQEAFGGPIGDDQKHSSPGLRMTCQTQQTHSYLSTGKQKHLPNSVEKSGRRSSRSQIQEIFVCVCSSTNTFLLFRTYEAVTKYRHQPGSRTQTWAPPGRKTQLQKS